MQCVQRHRVFVMDRGAQQTCLEPVRLSSVTWGRRKNAMSVGTFTVSGRDCQEQEAQLASIQTNRHEMVIFRDGIRVWEGPIIDARRGEDEATFTAYDVLKYLEGTALSQYWPNAEDGGTDVATERILEIITHELTTPYTMSSSSGIVTVPRWEGIEWPANVLPYLEVRQGTLLISTPTLAFEMSVFEHLDNLAKFGLNYTVIGRKILIWDSADSIGSIRRLTSADLNGQPILYDDGASFAAVQHVVGQPEAGADEYDLAHVGTAGGEDPYYGVWTKIDTHQEEDDEDADIIDAVNSQADRLIAERNPVPLELDTSRSSSLILGETLGIDDLVPGADVPVVMRYHGRLVDQHMTLDEVAVTETGSGETVSVTLSSARQVAD